MVDRHDEHYSILIFRVAAESLCVRFSAGDTDDTRYMLLRYPVFASPQRGLGMERNKTVDNNLLETDAEYLLCQTDEAINILYPNPIH